MSRNNIETIYPLSPMQQGLLFHTLLAPKTGMYFEQMTWTLNGDLDRSALKRAWQTAVNRHPILRTFFVWEGRDKPLQIVRRQVRIPWEEDDWRSLSGEEQQLRLQSLLQSDRERGFVLTQAPLIRLTLIQLTESSYQFIWSRHHLLIDGWSGILLLKEVFALYETYRQGQQLELAANRPYRDYIAWLQQQDLTKAEQYWRQTLKEFTTSTPLPLRPTTSLTVDEQDQYGKAQLSLSADSTAALNAFVRKHQLTLNTLVQGAWAMLLSRYSGETDVVFGTTVSGRPPDLAGVERMIGLFINTLPVRVQVRGEARVVEWLKQLQQQQVEMTAYEHTPLVQVQGWSEIERGRALFDTLLVFENYPVDQSLREPSGMPDVSQNAGLDVTHGYSVERASYALNLLAIPGRQLLLHIIYDRRKYEAESIERMLGHWQRLLEGLAGKPQGRLGELGLISAAERKQVIVEFNKGQREYPGEVTLPQLFEAQAGRAAEAVAVVCAKEQLKYGELNERSNQLAHYLQSQGVGAEELVGVQLERSAEMVIALLAVVKAGGAFVLLEPGEPGPAWKLSQDAVRLLLTRQEWVTDEMEVPAQVICLDTAQELIKQQRRDNPERQLSADKLAYVDYSSGRGLLVTHDSLCARLMFQQENLSLSATDRLLLTAGAGSISFAAQLFGPLLAGARLVLGGNAGEAAALGQLIEQHQLTLLHVNAAELSALLEQVPVESGARAKGVAGAVAGVERGVSAGPALGTLRAVVNSGEGLSGVIRQNYRERLSCPLYELTAIAEVGLEVLAHGRPTICSALILDAEGEAVPIGVEGQLYLSGRALPRGYLKQPGQTAESFRPNGFSADAGQRLVRSSERGRWSGDGTLVLSGSSERQVWVKGERVSLAEMELALLEQGEVAECAVRRRENRAGVSELVAYVVPKEPGRLTNLKGQMRARVPRAMCPAQYVEVGRLPLRADGRIDEAGLLGLEVIDEELVEQWRQQLSAVEGIEQVAVVVQEAREAVKELPLRELLGAWPLPELQSDNGQTGRETGRSDKATAEDSSAAAAASDSGAVEGERRKAISIGPALKLARAAPRVLSEALRRAAGQAEPRSVICVQRDGSQVQQSYAELLAEAEQILGGLRALGLKAGAKVIFQLEHNQDFIPGFWACILGGVGAGAAYDRSFLSATQCRSGEAL